MLIAEADVVPQLPAADGRASMEDLLGFEPGRSMVAYLSLLDVESLDEQSASVALTLVESAQAWLSELAVRLTAKVAGPTPPMGSGNTDPFGPDSIDRGVDVVAATLGLTSGGAQNRVDIARKITESLPKCRLAMAAGFMGYRQAWIVADAVITAGLGQVGVAAVDARVASRIKGAKLGGVSAHLAPCGVGGES